MNKTAFPVVAHWDLPRRRVTEIRMEKLGEETFSLDATEHKYLRLPTGKLRFEFKAVHRC